MAVKMVGPDRTSIENWMRAGTIIPALDLPGEDRRFSLENLLQIEILSRLRDRFKVQAGTAGFIAAEAVRDYLPRADRDLIEVWGGGAIGATDYRPTYGLTRGDDGDLRAAQRGDIEEDDVMIVIPVGLLARGLFAKAKAVVDAVAGD